MAQEPEVESEGEDRAHEREIDHAEDGPRCPLDRRITLRGERHHRVEAEALEVAARIAQLKQPAFRNNKRLAQGPTVELITSTLDTNIKALMPS